MKRYKQLGIYVLNHPELKIDFSNPSGGVIIIQGQEPDYEDKELFTTRKVKTNLTIYPKLNTENNIESTIDIVSRNKMGRFTPTFFTKDTLSLLSDQDKRKAIATYFEQNKEIGSIILLTSPTGEGAFITPVPEGFNIESGEIDLSEKAKENYEVETLKVYETPKDILSSMFNVMDKAVFEHFVESRVSRRIRTILKNNKSLMGRMVMNTSSGSSTMQEVSNAIDVLFYNQFRENGDNILSNPSKDFSENEIRDYNNMIEVLMGTEGTRKIIDFVTHLHKEGLKGKGFMKQLIEVEDAEETKAVLGFTPRFNDIVVFDPQAGSGDGILNAMSDTSFGGMLKGFELRDDIEYTDDRVEVLGGINTDLTSGMIKETFYNQMLKEATFNLFSYLNPPYTLDDELAKKTVKMLRNNMLMSGLFPTKMKQYLFNNLSQKAIVLEIPKHLTGYTQEKAPERFLFVLGHKFNWEEHAQENGASISGYSTSSPAFFSLPDDTSKEKFERFLHSHIRNDGHAITSDLYSQFEYYGESEKRSSLLYNQLSSKVTEYKTFIEDLAGISTLIEKENNKIFDVMMPINVAKTQKVFNDYRFYSSEGVYDKLNFREVSENIPLLVYYKENMPQIFKIIKEIADEKKITLPIDESIVKDFTLGETYSGEKTPVTSTDIGMMKLSFLPYSIDIEKTASKEILLEKLEKEYGIKPEAMMMLKAGIEKASKIVIKSERVVTSDDYSTEIAPKEILVLVDGYGGDIGKLEIPVSEFFDMLEKEGLYNLEDYVEVVSMPPSAKMKVIEGFLRQIELPIEDISKHNNIKPEDLKKEIIQRGLNYHKNLNEGSMSTDDLNVEILKFNKDYRLREMFDGYFSINNEALLKRLQLIAKKTLLQLGNKDAKTIGESLFNLFSEKPVYFFENQLVPVLDKLKEDLSSHGYDGEEGERKLEEHFFNFQEDLSKTLGDYYLLYESSMLSASRLSEILLYRYPIMQHFMSQDNVSEGIAKELYDKSFRPMLRNTMGLFEHQVAQGEGFLTLLLQGEKKTDFNFLQMRVGKTLMFINTALFVSYATNVDVTLAIETANMPDISGQLLRHFPHVAPSLMFIADSTKVPVNPNIVFDTLQHESITTVPFMHLKQAKITGGGEATKRLNDQVAKDYEEIEIALIKKYGEDFNREDLIKEHKKSRFSELLTYKCG